MTGACTAGVQLVRPTTTPTTVLSPPKANSPLTPQRDLTRASPGAAAGRVARDIHAIRDGPVRTAAVVAQLLTSSQLAAGLPGGTAAHLDLSPRASLRG